MKQPYQFIAFTQEDGKNNQGMCEDEAENDEIAPQYRKNTIEVREKGPQIALQQESNNQPFSREEDEILTDLIVSMQGRKIDWNFVTLQLNNQMNNGTPKIKAEIYQRWNRVLSSRYKKGYWSKEEDERLIEIINEMSEIDYRKIKAEFANRSIIEIKRHISAELHKWITCNLISIAKFGEK